MVGEEAEDADDLAPRPRTAATHYYNYHYQPEDKMEGGPCLSMLTVRTRKEGQ